MAIHNLSRVETSSHGCQLGLRKIVLCEWLNLQVFLVKETDCAKLFLHKHCINLSDQNLAVSVGIASIDAQASAFAEFLVVQSGAVLVAPADDSLSVWSHDSVNCFESEALGVYFFGRVFFASDHSFPIKLALVEMRGRICECGLPIAIFINFNYFGK